MDLTEVSVLVPFGTPEYQRHRVDPGGSDPDAVAVTTSAESRARVERVLPPRGSEDASHLLRRPCPPPHAIDFDDPDRDFLPNPDAEWVVHLEFDEADLRKETINAAFDRAWFQAHSRPMLYGHARETGRWTCVNAAGTPDVYAHLKLAWPLLPGHPGERVTGQRLRDHLEAVRSRARLLGRVAVLASISPGEAQMRAETLADLKRRCDRDVEIALCATPGRPFDGRTAWDVLRSLGLVWGDLDRFHFPNPSGAGDPSYFQVATTSPPGCFIPEAIAAGRVAFDDLLFVFSLPRSHDPETILDSMRRAARYAQARLGGHLLGPDGPLDDERLRETVRSTALDLAAVGLTPGSEAALLVF